MVSPVIEPVARLIESFARLPGIEAGIAEVVGHPVTVHCVVANVELPPAASDDLVAEARRIFAEELADVGEVS